VQSSEVAKKTSDSGTIFTQTAEVLPCVQSLGYQTAHKNVPSYAL